MEAKEVNSSEALMFDEMFMIIGKEVSSQIPVFDQVEAYTILPKSFIGNDSVPQFILHDRQESYEQLEMDGILVPRYVPAVTGYDFIKEKYYIEIHGNRFWKLFVEKHIDGDYNKGYIMFASMRRLLSGKIFNIQI
ncbi:hypothetical protein V6N11_073371 [Hibiscus sabdariffa]|uniref:TF-B3 domain-containing protein n=1 Tax=Hibiscus sabdariffa TaxID=183260 RepID=A0ABR2P489_9ROSI